jgi:TRAP-type transport system periplasmic protein
MEKQNTRRRMMMKRLGLFGVSLFLALVETACGNSQSTGSTTTPPAPAASPSTTNPTTEKIMKVGLGVPKEHYMYQAMEKFKDHVETKTNHAIKVELYPANQIGADKAVLDSIKIGAAQMNLPSPAVLANYIKDFNLMTLPFLFPTQEVADKVMEGPVGKEFLDKLPSEGFVGLGFGDFGFRHITNNKRPIKTIDDFKGLKIRTMQNAAHLDVFRALGANPTPMSFDQVFNALQQNVIDGQENPLMNIYSNKLQEAQKYLTLDGHVYEWVVLVVGKEFYDGLNSDQQKILQESARLAIEDMRVSMQKQDQEALEALKKAGMIVNEISPEVKQQMQEKVKPVVEKYAQESNKEFYDKLMSEIQKYSK